MIKIHTTLLVKIRCFLSAYKWSCGLLYSLLNRYRLVSDWFRPDPGESYWLSRQGKNEYFADMMCSFSSSFDWSKDFQSRSCPGTAYRCKILLITCYNSANLALVKVDCRHYRASLFMCDISSPF